jgi:hypothetical protein
MLKVLKGSIEVGWCGTPLASYRVSSWKILVKNVGGFK